MKWISHGSNSKPSTRLAYAIFFLNLFLAYIFYIFLTVSFCRLAWGLVYARRSNYEASYLPLIVSFLTNTLDNWDERQLQSEDKSIVELNSGAPWINPTSGQRNKQNSVQTQLQKTSSWLLTKSHGVEFGTNKTNPANCAQGKIEIRAIPHENSAAWNMGHVPFPDCILQFWLNDKWNKRIKENQTWVACECGK